MADRDKRGRFAAGNHVGKGRPQRATEEQFLGLLVSCVTSDDWKSITAKAMEQARSGDYQARKWLTDYLIGQPVVRESDEKREIDRVILERMTDEWASGTPSNTDRVPSSGQPMPPANGHG